MSQRKALYLLERANAEDQAHTCTAKVKLEAHWDEESHQIRFIQWASEHVSILPELIGLTHVPNGGKRPQKIGRNGRVYAPEAVKLKHMGARPGYPDLLLDVAVGDFHGLRIELKKQGGALRPEQRAWLVRLRKYGYCADVVHGWREARKLTLEYLAGTFSGYHWQPRHQGRISTLPPLPFQAPQRHTRHK